jgi:hypothetical protein
MKGKHSSKKAHRTSRTKPTKSAGVTGQKNRSQTPTYELSSIGLADPTTPFTLPIRQPGWFPDGVDVGTKKRQRLFLEEVAGTTDTGLAETFPVEFDDTGTSKKWILGSRIDTTKKDSLTSFVQKLAVKVRQYNASLYRLRRLHFYWDYKDQDSRLVTFPPPNPYGDPTTDPDPTKDLQGFTKMAQDAEADWIKVCDQVNDLLETASTDGNSSGITLIAADMIAANGYIVSMRIVVKPPEQQPPGGVPPPEPDGSSSHVSLHSPFSSSKP